jgi:RNA recognition motif-containing protein
MRLYVTNLPPDANAAELRTIFEPFGDVSAAAVWGVTNPTDRVGLVGLVVKPQGASIAAHALDRTMLRGLEMRVNVITPWDI